MLGVCGVLFLAEDFKVFYFCAKGFVQFYGKIGFVESVVGDLRDSKAFFGVGGVGRELGVLGSVLRVFGRDSRHNFVYFCEAGIAAGVFGADAQVVTFFVIGARWRPEGLVGRNSGVDFDAKASVGQLGWRGLGLLVLDGDLWLGKFGRGLGFRVWFLFSGFFLFLGM